MAHFDEITADRPNDQRKPIVAFDEAGNTGSNLGDPEQPFFVLVSVSFPDEAIRKLTQGQTQELKVAKLKKSATGRKKILEILDSPEITKDRLVVSVVYKPFMAITKMVDLLIEPIYHASGEDIYVQGQNIAMANMYFYALPHCLVPCGFDGLIRAFVKMVRTPGPDTIKAFYDIIRLSMDHAKDSFLGVLGQLFDTQVVVIADEHFGCGGELDPAISEFVRHSTIWTQRLGREFVIIHDESKPIVENRDFLESLMSAHEKPVIVGYDRRKAVFPICAQGIDTADSVAELQIQIADIIAGAFFHYYVSCLRKVEDEFANQIKQTRTLGIPIHPLLPQPKVTPEDLETTETGGLNSIDYVAGRLGAKSNSRGAAEEERGACRFPSSN